MNKSVLVLCCHGFEEIEAVTVIDVLRRAGVSVTVCSAEGKTYIEGSHGIEIKADKLFGQDDIEGKEYDAVVLPGGLPNAHLLRDNEDVIRCVKNFFMEGKLVCAICAAPCVLERAGLLVGRKATSYPGSVAEESCGEYLEEDAVRDGNMITSRGPGTALAFSYEVLRALGCGEAASRLEKSMIYKK